MPPFKPYKRPLLLLAATIALLYLGLCAFMWSTQRELIFRPQRVMRAMPEQVGLAYEEVHIPVGHGAQQGQLYAWWIPATQAQAPTLLYLHGNDKNISHDLGTASRLHALGYNLLMVDYRGYGRSTGSGPSEANAYEDAQAAWAYVLAHRSTARRTFIYGHSLGGAIAIELALHQPQAAGLIVESSFTSILAMGKLEYGYLPVNWMLNQHFDSLGKVGQLKIPVLFLHGTADKKVPAFMSQQLFDQTPPPKFLTFIEGGEHNNNSQVGPVQYQQALNTFIRKYAP